MSLHRKLAQLSLHYVQVSQEGVRTSGQGGPQLRERFLSIGQEKATKVPTEQERGIGPVQPLQFLDLPLEVGMILIACQAHPLWITASDKGP